MPRCHIIWVCAAKPTQLIRPYFGCGPDQARVAAEPFIVQCTTSGAVVNAYSMSMDLSKLRLAELWRNLLPERRPDCGAPTLDQSNVAWRTRHTIVCRAAGQRK